MKSKIEFTDKELITGIINMDNHVLKYVIESCDKPIRHFIVTNNGSGSDADDIIQEAIIVLFRKVKDKDFRLTANISTFVFSIARLLWFKELKKRSINSTSLDEIEEIKESSNILATIEKNDRLQLYREKFEELNDDCKKILRLFHLGTPMKQITQIMGFGSDDYTKKRKYICKNILVEKIKSTTKFKELGHGFNEGS